MPLPMSRYSGRDIALAPSCLVGGCNLNGVFRTRCPRNSRRAMFEMREQCRVVGFVSLDLGTIRRRWDCNLWLEVRDPIRLSVESILVKAVRSRLPVASGGIIHPMFLSTWTQPASNCSKLDSRRHLLSLYFLRIISPICSFVPLYHTTCLC